MTCHSLVDRDVFDIDHKNNSGKRMFNRRNFLIKSISSLLYLPFSGCAKAVGLSSINHEQRVNKLSDSPNFNKSTKRFQHPAGDRHDKSFGDLFDFFREYFSRPDDKWETTGFPVVKSRINELQNFKENVLWVGHASIMINHLSLIHI